MMTAAERAEKAREIWADENRTSVPRELIQQMDMEMEEGSLSMEWWYPITDDQLRELEFFGYKVIEEEGYITIIWG